MVKKDGRMGNEKQNVNLREDPKAAVTEFIENKNDLVEKGVFEMEKIAYWIKKDLENIMVSMKLNAHD